MVEASQEDGKQALTAYVKWTDEELNEYFEQNWNKKDKNPEDQAKFDAICDETRRREDSRVKKDIILPQEGKLYSEVAQEMGEVFGSKHEIFFRPVENAVVKLERHNLDDKQNEEKVLQFQEVTDEGFVTYAEQYLRTGLNKKSKDPYGDARFVPKSMTKGMAGIILASEYQFRAHLPVIETIYNVPLPTLKDGKLVFPKAGYDPEMLSWLPHSAPKLDVGMTLEQAKEIIDKIYKDFCFTKEQDRINAISSGLTPMCRGIYKDRTSRTPIYFWKATRERSGKDYGSGVVGILYEGFAVEDPAISSSDGTNDEEFRKKILATLKSGRMRIHSSNNKGDLNSAVLEGVSTSSYWEDRQLGSNTMLRFPNTLEISLSANVGIYYTPDLGARCVFINLSYFDEDPNKREFAIPDLHGWVKEHRSEVLSAFYTLVKNWHEKGMPEGKVPFTSYPEWARVVGGILETAGYGSPCKPNDDSDANTGDTETNNMKRLFELAYKTWPGRPVKKKEIVDQILCEDSDFSEVFQYLPWNDKPNSAKIKFGVLLHKFDHRVLSGIRMEGTESDHSERKEYTWLLYNDPIKKSNQFKLGGLVGLGGNSPSNHTKDDDVVYKGVNPHLSLPNPPKEGDNTQPAGVGDASPAVIETGASAPVDAHFDREAGSNADAEPAYVDDEF